MKSHDKLEKCVDWLFKNKDGKWAIIQVPNVLLSIWLVLTIVHVVAQDGTIKQGVSSLRDAVLFAWSYLEVTKGDSKFRRLLGGVVLIFVTIRFF